MARRYRINTWRLSGVDAIDRETPKYWIENHPRPYHPGETYEQKAKKSSSDLVFETFEEAKAELVARLKILLDQAEQLEAADYLPGCRDEWRPKPITGGEVDADV